MDDPTVQDLSQNFYLFHAADRAGLVFWEWDEVKDCLSYCSEGYARMMGKSKAEIMATSGSSSEEDRRSLHPADLERYIEADEQAWKNGVGVDIQYRIIKPDGEVRHLHEISEVLKNEAGEVIQSSGTVQDITDTMLIRAELNRSLTNARQAEGLAGLGFWEFDEVEDRLTYCSDGYARLMGMTREQVMARLSTSKQNYSFFHEDDVQRYLDAERQAWQEGDEFDIKYRIITREGNIRHLHEVSEATRNDKGVVIRSSGTLQDITEVTLIQEELTRALAVSDRAEKLAKLGTYTWNWRDMRFESCSEEYARQHDKTVAHIMQDFNEPQDYYAMIHPDDREAVKINEAAALAKGEDYSAAYRLLLPNGDIRYLREICEIEMDKQHKVIRTVGSTQDITEQMQLQEQLNHAVKLRAIGELTGGVAHDFNNLLTVITGNVELVMQLLGDANPNTKLLLTALKAATQGADLTSRLLAFARRQDLKIQSVDLQSLVLGLKEMLQRTLGETVNVEVEDTGLILASETDVTQFESAILNLAINARDAMPKGGRLTITLNTVTLDEEFVSTLEDLQPGDYIRLSLTDTGIGMSNEVLERVFDPFYTTKEIGHGTGLGLSMVYGFLKQCHGHVSIASQPGKGAEVSLFFPLNSDKPIELLSEEPAEKEKRGDGELILVVEDNEAVRHLVLHLVGNMGYQTVEAENAKQALDLLDTLPAIKLVFTDVVLPGGIDGVELAEKAWLKRPELNILFTSGYSRESRLQTWESGQYLLLEKPYDRTKLASLLYQALL